MVIKNTLFLLLVLVFVGCRKVPSNYTANNLPQAQTTPPDMVFVWGDGSIPSFYMGVSEECNINYQIYRNWQKQVFIDYPEVYQNSKPKNRDVSHLLQFNDPYYSYYQNHEAFAYYPVVGLSWVQAMDYLQWKGDRLNEKILYETGVHNERDIYQQVNEQNFNTEAYLSGQYDGMVKRDLVDEDPYGTTRKVRYDDGIFLATPRLPTEAEWEYALATQPSKPINAKTYANPFSKEAMFPFGRDYYTFTFGQKQGLEFYELLEQGFPYHIKYDSIPNKPDRLTGAADFDLKAAGIANLEGNVPEWLMDEYANESEYTTLPFQEYFTKYCAVQTPDSFLYNYDYGKQTTNYDEKDSLGRMPFSYFGIPSKTDLKTPLHFSSRKNQGLFVEYTYEKEYLDSTKHTIVPSNYNISRKLNIIIHDRAKNDPYYNGSIYYNGYNNYYGNLSNKDTSHYLSGITNTYISITSTNHYQFKVEVDNLEYRNIYKDSSGYYLNVPIYISTEINTDSKYRVVKGGSWKAPNAHKREKMYEDDASPNVGFRAVITYTGFPVFNQKYKVKWK